MNSNDAALRSTAINAALATTPNVFLHRSNLLSVVDGRFYLIIAALPYLLNRAWRIYRRDGVGLDEGFSHAITRLPWTELAPSGALLLYTGTVIVDGVDHIRAAITALLNDTDVEWEYRKIDPDIFGDSLLKPAYAGAERIASRCWPQ